MHIIILVTCANKKEAGIIAEKLVQRKLAACVNIIDRVNSLFRWEGKIDKTQETLLIIKSQKTELNKIIKTVKSLHSYQVPEIIAIPIIGGNKEYLGWINESLR